MRALLPRIGSTVYQACRAHLSRQWPIACCAPAALSRARPLCSAMASLAGRSQEAPLAAVAQMTATGDTNRNFETCKELAEEAARKGCSMLFLPECCAFIGRNREETLAAAQPLDGPLMTRYRGLARETGLWLSLGGFQETGPDAGHTHNTHVVLDARGNTAAAYRKVHLFDVDQSKQGGPVLMESRGTAPGHELVACDSPVGRLGLTVCYDLRFPAVYQELVYTLGAEVLLVPSAFTVRTGEAHWHVLLRARAVETQTYVLAAAQVGRHNEARESYGHTLAVDPWGTIVGEVGEPATGIAVVRIDLQELRRVRANMPVREHRRQGRISLGWEAA